MPSIDSYLIDQEAARMAVQMSRPLIHAAMESGKAGAGGFLHIVVMNPGAHPSSSSFEEAILYEEAVYGDPAKWDADYAEFARAKAKIAWRTGMDSHKVQELMPHLLTQGDTLLWGSVALDGFVVAASGADPWFDEVFAGSVALCLRALAKARIVRERKEGLFLR